MATMPAASVLGEDGGRSAGEVAPGVTLVKNVRIPVRDGTRLAADVYFPSSALEAGDPVSLVMEYIPYRKDEVAPGHRFYEYLPQQGYVVARVDIRGTWRLAGHDARRVPAAGAARRSRLRRVVRRAGHGAPGTST